MKQALRKEQTMKTRRTLALVAALLTFTFIAIPAAQAGHHHHHGHHSFGVYVGLPGVDFVFGRPCYPAPVYYYEPAPVVVYEPAPAPVVVRPAPVVVRSAPVVVYREPAVVYTAPRPVRIRVYPHRY